MSSKDSTAVILAVVAGVAVGALAVYIYLTQASKTQVTDFTRDADGRIITIIQKAV